jgi:hypothetical protein
MSEELMVESIATALTRLGVPEDVEAAGEFQPRGHTGSMFVGGFVGDGLGGGLPGVGDSVATVGGALAAAHLHDAASGLPEWMIVGVTPTHVCGFAAARRRREAGALVFRVPRSSLEVKVHRRVNVRVLELIDSSTGARIELEGNRMPVTHSKDVIEALDA